MSRLKVFRVLFTISSLMALIFSASRADTITVPTDSSLPIECQIEGQEGDNFRYLAAQCWLPPSEKVRGILCVILHPDGSNGRTLASSQGWVKFAGSLDLALMGVSIVESMDSTSDWCKAAQGSGRALLKAINQIAKETQHPEMASAKISVAGVCAAGQFAYEFAALAPERTASFVTIGGSLHNTKVAYSASQIPGLLIMTPDRGKKAASNLKKIAALGKILNSRWQAIEGSIQIYDSGLSQAEVKYFLTESWGRRSYNKELSDFYPVQFLLTMDMPFLGKSLPVFAELQISTVQTKANAKRNLQEVALKLKKNPLFSYDQVSVESPLVKEQSTFQSENNEWEIKLILDVTSIPSGVYFFELPLRFQKNKHHLLGGLQIPITGVVERDIYVTPRTGRLIEADGSHTWTVRLTSKTDSTISNIKLEKIYPAELDIETIYDKEGATIVIKSYSPATTSQGQGKNIAGYAILRATSDEEQLIKISFYGIGKNKFF